MNDTQLASMARKLAMRHIHREVEAHISEKTIQQSYHTSGRSHEHWHDSPDGFGGYEVSIGGYYDLETPNGIVHKRVKPTEIVVTEVCGVAGVWIFSLHEIYEACRHPQLTLF